MRQLAAIEFKNSVKLSWRDCKEKSSKDYVRNNILIAIYTSPREVSVQLLETTDRLVFYDFPRKWLSLVQMLKTVASTDSTANRADYLSIIRSIALKYSNEPSDEVQPFYNVVKQLAYPLHQRLEQILANINYADENMASLLYEYLKTFRYFVKFHLPPFLRKPVVMTKILATMLKVLQLKFPPELCVCILFSILYIY